MEKGGGGKGGAVGGGGKSSLKSIPSKQLRTLLSLSHFHVMMHACIKNNITLDRHCDFVKVMPRVWRMVPIDV